LELNGTHQIVLSADDVNLTEKKYECNRKMILY